MFLKHRKSNISNSSIGKLRAIVTTLKDEKKFNEEIYEARLEKINNDKKIQEDNNTKLINLNSKLIKIINEAKSLEDLDEIKKILNNAPTSLIS